jgi:hypothetical protein
VVPQAVSSAARARVVRVMRIEFFCGWIVTNIVPTAGLCMRNGTGNKKAALKAPFFIMQT